MWCVYIAVQLLFVIPTGVFLLLQDCLISLPGWDDDFDTAVFLTFVVPPIFLIALSVESDNFLVWGFRILFGFLTVVTYLGTLFQFVRGFFFYATREPYSRYANKDHDPRNQ